MGFFRRSKKSLLEKWINIPAVLEVPSLKEKVEGVIKFGIRIPIAPGYRALLECHTSNTKDRYRGEKADYWFVHQDKDRDNVTETHPIKIRLLTVQDKNGVLYGLGHDINDFKYIIRKK